MYCFFVLLYCFAAFLFYLFTILEAELKSDEGFFVFIKQALLIDLVLMH